MTKIDLSDKAIRGCAQPLDETAETARATSPTGRAPTGGPQA